MSGFENFLKEAKQIESEIVRKGIILDIDWEDAAAMRELAHEAFEFKGKGVALGKGETDLAKRARVELFGLAQLMLMVMRESADENIYTQGGPVWKAFGRALWDEYCLRNQGK